MHCFITKLKSSKVYLIPLQLPHPAQLPAHLAASPEPHELDRGEQLRAGKGESPSQNPDLVTVAGAAAPSPVRRSKAGDDADKIPAAPKQQVSERRVHIATELELRGAVQAGM